MKLYDYIRINRLLTFSPKVSYLTLMNQLIKNLVFTNIKLEWIPIKWWQLITEKLKTSLYSQEHTKYLNSNFSIIHVLLNLHPIFHQHMETWPSTQSSPRDEIYTTWIYLYTSKCLFHYFNLVIIFYFLYFHLTIHLFYLYFHLFLLFTIFHYSQGYAGPCYHALRKRKQFNRGRS